MVGNALAIGTNHSYVDLGEIHNNFFCSLDHYADGYTFALWLKRKTDEIRGCYISSGGHSVAICE